MTVTSFSLPLIQSKMLVEVVNYAEETIIRASEWRSMTSLPDIVMGSKIKIRGMVAVAMPSRRYELLVVHGTMQS